MAESHAHQQDLSAFIDDVLGDGHLRIETDYGDGFVRLRSSEAQKRQAAQDIRCTEDIVIELLRNARDAHAHAIYIAMQREDNLRSLVCIDDGDGIPESMQKLIFEPRVTSKLNSSSMDKWGLHGRGMALYSIDENSSEASVVTSKPQMGTSIIVRTDLSSLGEKTDQSTFPTFEKRDGVFAMRGPKNILRTSAEFALEHRHDCQVYVGSAVEVAATLYQQGKSILTPVQQAFSSDISALPLVFRLATAGTPQEFCSIASSLGLDMSERTARRIIDGTIQPLCSLVERMEQESFGLQKARNKHAAQGSSNKKAPKLSDEDLARFKEQIQDAFSEIAQAYYLDESVDFDVNVSRGVLRVSVPLKHQP